MEKSEKARRQLLKRGACRQKRKEMEAQSRRQTEA
jgi:hypothetical protein